MRDFFLGWRRKLGCITVVVACMLTGVWLRSRVVEDRISTGNCLYVSRNGALYFATEDSAIASLNYDRRLKWTTLPISELLPDQQLWVFEDKLTVIPVRHLAVLLGVISAWLILWKPPKRT